MKMLRIVADKEKCNDTYKQRGNYLRAIMIREKTRQRPAAESVSSVKTCVEFKMP